MGPSDDFLDKLEREKLNDRTSARWALFSTAFFFVFYSLAALHHHGVIDMSVLYKVSSIVAWGMTGFAAVLTTIFLAIMMWALRDHKIDLNINKNLDTNTSWWIYALYAGAGFWKQLAVGVGSIAVIHTVMFVYRNVLATKK